MTIRVAGVARTLHSGADVARRFERKPPRAIDEGLWVCDVDGWDRGLHVRLRMTIARLADGTLWLYSPIPFDDALAEQVQALGRVAHLVAPSRGHHLFAGEAKARWPDATLWASPGLAATRPELQPDAVLDDDDDPWPSQLRGCRLAAIPAIDEVAFLHVATRTLLCCDLVLNVSDDPNWLARTLYRMLGVWRHPGPTRYWRWKTVDRDAARQSYDRILAWQPRRIVMAHGDIVDTDATAWLTAALGR